MPNVLPPKCYHFIYQIFEFSSFINECVLLYRQFSSPWSTGGCIHPLPWSLWNELRATATPQPVRKLSILRLQLPSSLCSQTFFPPFLKLVSAKEVQNNSPIRYSIFKCFRLPVIWINCISISEDNWRLAVASI